MWDLPPFTLIPASSPPHPTQHERCSLKELKLTTNIKMMISNLGVLKRQERNPIDETKSVKNLFKSDSFHDFFVLWT